MYKIKLACIDPPYNEAPYADEVSKDFEFIEEAKVALLECVIDEAQSLNEPDADYTPRTKVFVIVRNYEHEGRKYDAALVVWDWAEGIHEQLVTGYYVEWVSNNAVEEYNRKLRDWHGEYITVKIRSEMGLTDDDDDDAEEHEVFFYTSARFGDCDERYATAEKAYEAANDYLNSLDY